MTAPSAPPVHGTPPHPLWPGLLLAGAGSIAFSGKAIIVKPALGTLGVPMSKYHSERYSFA